jgi:hypothetical protein
MDPARASQPWVCYSLSALGRTVQRALGQAERDSPSALGEQGALGQTERLLGEIERVHGETERPR